MQSYVQPTIHQSTHHAHYSYAASLCRSQIKTEGERQKMATGHWAEQLVGGRKDLAGHQGRRAGNAHRYLVF